MVQDAFATEATLRKLKAIEDYLNSYTKALSKQGFRLNYFDAFAGTGSIPYSDELPLFDETLEVEPFSEGSARRSLKLSIPFNRYFFCDSRRSNVAELNGLKTEFASLATRITVLRGDANEEIERYCKSLTAKDRTVFFLDPFGNQVAWSTIEAIARTKSDLWYLFPAGLGVVRQISDGREVRPEVAASLNRLFGDESWKECVFESDPQQTDLFGQSNSVANRKVATAANVTRFMISKMQSLFYQGKVVDKWLPLGPGQAHWYSLIFACSNSSQKAQLLANRIATHVMTRN